MKDILNQEYDVGDLVVVACMQYRSAKLVVGEVTKIKQVGPRDSDYTIQVQPLTESGARWSVSKDPITGQTNPAKRVTYKIPKNIIKLNKTVDDLLRDGVELYGYYFV